MVIGFCLLMLSGISENVFVRDVNNNEKMGKNEVIISSQNLNLDSQIAYIGKIDVFIPYTGVPSVTWDLKKEIEVNWTINPDGDVEGRIAFNYTVKSYYDRGYLEFIATFMKFSFKIYYDRNPISKAWRIDYIYEGDRAWGTFTRRVILPSGQQIYNLTASDFSYQQYFPKFSEYQPDIVNIRVHPI